MQIDLFKWGMALETDEGELKGQVSVDKQGFSLFIPRVGFKAFNLTIGKPLSWGSILALGVMKGNFVACVFGIGIDISW